MGAAALTDPLIYGPVKNTQFLHKIANFFYQKKFILLHDKISSKALKMCMYFISPNRKVGVVIANPLPFPVHAIALNKNKKT